jgi:mannose-6-phosphate isomerase
MTYQIHQPLRFAPYFRPMPWGGRKIARFLGKNLPTPQPYGESWEVSDHPLHQSRLATAFGHGVTLRQLMTANRGALLGPAADRHAVFPWLIKLLDAEDWLSVQVHPDPEAVKTLLPGEGSKTEAWYVLDAEPGSRIYAGLKPGVGPQELRSALDSGNVIDCLHSFTPKPGDFVYLPAGTVHAVGGGVFFAEIQETSDATFRLFDWHRRDHAGQPRRLHRDEGLASINWDQGPIEPMVAADARLVACPYFEVDRIGGPGPFTLGGVNRLQALIVTAGQGRFNNGEFVMAGDVWILPAALPKMTLRMDSQLMGLRCTLPSEPEA